MKQKGLGVLIWEIVTSRTLSVYLLLIVTGMLTVGSLLPSPQFLSPQEVETLMKEHPTLYWLAIRFNSQEIARGYVFGVTGLFLVLSTVLCSMDRLMTHFRKEDSPVLPPPSAQGIGIKSTYNELPSERAIETIQKNFTGPFWKIMQNADSDAVVITASRGLAGFWGSVFFHAILIAMLIGLSVFYLGSYRGTLNLTEGQTLELKKESFKHIIKEPLWGLRLPKARLSLMKQYNIYDMNDPFYPIDHVAHIRVDELAGGRQWDKEVKVNDPLVISGKKFLLTKGGFSPRITVTRQDGTNVVDSFVALGNEGGMSDSLKFQSEDLTLLVKVYPDMFMQDGLPDTRSMQLKNPFLSLKALKGGELVYDGLMPLNGNAGGNGYSFSFGDIRRWVSLELVGEPGLGFFFVVAFLGLAGVALRMIDPDEKIYFIIREQHEGLAIEAVPLSKHFSALLVERAEDILKQVGVPHTGKP